MARDLAHEERSEQKHSPDEKKSDGGKRYLNRREYMILGATAAATAVGAGTDLAGAASDGDGTTYKTDFGEYAL